MRELNLPLLAFIATILCACSEPPEPTKLQSDPSVDLSHSLRDLDAANRAFSRYLAEASEHALHYGRLLKQNAQDFLNQPNQKNLETLQADWLALEIALQKSHPVAILSNIAPNSIQPAGELFARVTAHPIQPGYLDRFGDYAYSGLVYDIGLALTRSSLNEQNGLTDAEEVVFGIYAIEFMLFGTEAGRRAEDFYPQLTLTQTDRDRGLKSPAEIPENRRRQLLSIQLEQLVEDLEQLSVTLNTAGSLSAWKALPPQQQLNTVRRALNAALTQTLIDLADHQTRFIGKQSPSLPRLPAEDAQRNLKALQQRLFSLNIWADYFSPLEQESIRSVLENAANALSSPSLLDSANPQAARQALQSIYENIKTLI